MSDAQCMQVACIMHNAQCPLHEPARSTQNAARSMSRATNIKHHPSHATRVTCKLRTSRNIQPAIQAKRNHREVIVCKHACTYAIRCVHTQRTRARANAHDRCGMHNVCKLHAECTTHSVRCTSPHAARSTQHARRRIKHAACDA
jgi:hypothetical protein